jgi:alpha-D-xyloside xylohydrolase
MPYLYSEATRAIKNGWPTSVRHMALEFPWDRTAWTCDAQFMLGSSILVAPVFCESGEVEFYLPDGNWVNFWDESGEIVEGPQWIKETHDFTTLPMYVLEGTVLVTGREDETRTDYDWMKEENRIVKHYGNTEGESFDLWDAKGEHSEVVVMPTDMS